MFVNNHWRRLPVSLEIIIKINFLYMLPFFYKFLHHWNCLHYKICSFFYTHIKTRTLCGKIKEKKFKKVDFVSAKMEQFRFKLHTDATALWNKTNLYLYTYEDRNWRQIFNRVLYFVYLWTDIRWFRSDFYDLTQFYWKLW